LFSRFKSVENWIDFAWNLSFNFLLFLAFTSFFQSNWIHQLQRWIAPALDIPP
jgi:hypothetical protein